MTKLFVTPSLRYSPVVFETFAHTADLGLRARAGDLAGLFREAARGLFSIIVEDLESVRPLEQVTIALEGEDVTYLLFDWLAELLRLFDTRQLLLSHFEVRVTESGLEATACGETIDPPRHGLDHEVKAITYHGLRVEETDGAELIVDI
jgi:SHS2 domain-containing protein